MHIAMLTAFLPFSTIILSVSATHLTKTLQNERGITDCWFIYSLLGKENTFYFLLDNNIIMQ